MLELLAAIVLLDLCFCVFFLPVCFGVVSLLPLASISVACVLAPLAWPSLDSRVG